MTGCVELKIRETCTQVHLHTYKSIIYRHTYIYDIHACAYACSHFQSITSAPSLTSSVPGSGLKPSNLATALPGWPQVLVDVAGDGAAPVSPHAFEPVSRNRRWEEGAGGGRRL